MPTLEVQARAKKQGLKISRNHIYTIRGTMKKEREATAAQNSGPAPTSAASVIRLQAAILDLGLEKSSEVFANVRANLAHLFEQPASKVQSAVHASL
jgi:hypothetical protein